jgi:hypothetical protein
MSLATRLVWMGALVLTGCTSLGPPTVVRDRFDYVAALSDSSKQQMLLNLLKVRYGDAPVFMDVASVIGSYSLEGAITGTGSYAIPGGGYRSGDQIAGVQAQGAYSDRPTITYMPLAGEKFARSLMAPIPLQGILLLIQSGYPADVVLRVCVNTINGLENAYGGLGNPRKGSPAFYQLMLALRQAQALQAAGFRIRPIKGTDEVMMFVRPPMPGTAAYTARIRQLLRLNATKLEFRVVPGAYADNDSEIALQARSLLQVMVDFASYVDVPESDVAEGRVYSPHRDAEQERMFPRLVTVSQGSSRPNTAFVAVQYRNQWFWIDDRDPQSKLLFSFLILIFSLTETPQGQPAPVVTIPAR